MSKPRLLTGDTPTGKLHLGHLVGSLENRVKLQDQYDCYFLLANYHAFTTKPAAGKEIHDSVLEIVLEIVKISKLLFKGKSKLSLISLGNSFQIFIL